MSPILTRVSGNGSAGSGFGFGRRSGGNRGPAPGSDPSNSIASAKALIGTGSASGTYYVSTPGGVYQIYCDMSTDGGGWTRYARSTGTNDSNFNIRSDYGFGGGSVTTSSYCMSTYKNARDSTSSTGECEYLISMNNGSYILKISTLFQKGTNNYSNRTSTFISGAGTMNTYMTESELNSNAVSYWEGSSGTYSRGDVGQACKTMELSIASASYGFNIGQYSFRTSGSGSRCSDWCGESGSYGINKRLVPYMERSETCYSGYSPGVTNSVTVTNCDVYFREK
jgi:hypothetical protein